MASDWLAAMLPGNRISGLTSFLSNMDFNMEIS